jgi:hypothetical protein
MPVVAYPTRLRPSPPRNKRSLTTELISQLATKALDAAEKGSTVVFILPS